MNNDELSNYVLQTAPAREHCTKGHRWENDDRQRSYDWSIILHMPNGQDYYTGKLCPYCLADKLRKLLKDVGVVSGDDNG